MATARLPDGSMAASMPAAPRAIFSSRIGSPATKWLRTSAPVKEVMASGLASRLMNPSLMESFGQDCQRRLFSSSA